MKRLMISTFFFVIACLAIHTSSAQAADTTLYHMQQKAYVYAQMDASTKATGSLQASARFYAQPASDGWLYVPNKKGYVQVEYAQPLNGEYVVVNAENIVLYKAATKSSQKLSSVISQSVAIRYNDVAAGWSLVSYNGTFGYMPTSVLAAPTVTETKVYVTDAELRNKPTKSAPVMAMIPADVELQVYTSFLGWSFIANDTYSGYVKTADITDNTPAPVMKKIALTFDDGPHKKVTPQVLATLKQYDAKATFFVIGEEAERNAAILKQAASEGHQIGNHSFSHDRLSTLSIRAVIADLEKTNAVIQRITGTKPTVYRPPFGAITQQMRTSISMPPILWSLDTLDWKHRNADKTVDVITNGAKDGAIVLMHDIHQPTADALPRVLEVLQAQGYTFVTIDEL
ncbi:MAG: polysaccharide deacetylase family protein [Caryophanon sp.]|nr:polysaccharide deacetylase family protein [Caryophanon sp.]